MNPSYLIIVAIVVMSLCAGALMSLLEQELPIDSITVMVQKEVAERMQAAPGTKDYGALSLAVQYRAETYIAANVPPNCFMPRPAVGSCVIRLKKKQEPPVAVKSPELMFKLIRAAFNQRRKTLLNAISNSGEISLPKDKIAEAIKEAGLDENIRGEVLGLPEFGRLADVLSQ